MQYKVGIYVRLSRDDERDGESMSIETQKQMLTAYVQEQGWELIDCYCDDGWSGTTFERPSFQRMIADVESHKINLVLVKDLSRFGRNFVQMGLYTDYILPSAGCRFVALNDNVDSLNGDNDMMPVKNLINEFYSRDQSKKVKSSRVVRAKDGKFVGAFAPFGYRLDPDNRYHMLIDEEAAPLVRRIFDLRKQGCGYRKIAAVFNEDGIITPTNYRYNKLGQDNPHKNTFKWSDVTVRAILGNEAYIGNTVQFKTGAISFKNRKHEAKPEENWIRVEGTHEPIIDRDTWDMVRELAAKKSRYRAQGNGEISLFSGLLECADCHSSMKLCRDYNQRKDGHRNNNHAYICCNYSSGGPHACTAHRTHLKALTALVTEDIRKHAARIGYNERAVAEELMRKKNAGSLTERALTEKQLHEARQRLAQLDALIQKAYEEMVAGDIPRDMLLGLLERYRAEKEELSAQAKECETALEAAQDTDDDIHKWISLMKRNMTVTEPDRELLLSLIDKIIIGQKKEVDGVAAQEIIIRYNFVGVVD